MRLLILSLGLLAGCDSPRSTKKATEPEPVKPTTAPRRLAVPPPKPKEFVRPPLVEPELDTEPPRPLTFDEAWGRLPLAASLIREAADKEYEEKAKLLTAEELISARFIMNMPGGREKFGANDFVFMRKCGFTRWVWAKTISWAHADPVFKDVAESIWKRSPQTRTVGELAKLAMQWGSLDGYSQQGVRQLVAAVEGGITLPIRERDIVIDFAGEDYYANRP